MINTKFQFRYLIFIFILFCAVSNSFAQNENTKTSEPNPYMNITFKNIQDQRIKDCFLEVYNRYDSLHDYEITLIQKRVKASTMQAQPILSLKSLFSGVKKYRIKLALYVKDSDDILVSELPEEVLTGWFAHELGHLVDYEPRSNFGMIVFGLRYIFSEKFKRSVEHDADSIAVAKGFAPEIIATKRFILENDFLGDNYKSAINKYYMSIDDVEIFMEEDHAPTLPKIEI